MSSKVIRVLVMSVAALLIGALAVVPAFATIKVRYPNWQWAEPGFKEIFTAAAEQFAKENPGAVIDGYVVSPSDYYDKLTIEMKAGNPPDIVMLRDSNISQFISMGQLTPLRGWMESTGILGRFVQAQNVVGASKGEIYGMIAFAKTWQLIYNEKLLAEAGVAVPRTPDEFLKAAKALTIVKDGRTTQYGFATMTLDKAPLYTYMLPWVIGMGGAFAKDGKPTATHPNTIKGAAFYKELFDSKVIPLGVEEPVYRQLFWEGKVAMIVDGPWMLTFVKDKNPSLYPHIGVALLPFGDRYGTAGFNLLGVPKGAKNKELALKYLEILARPEYQRMFLELTNLPPGSKDAMSAKFLKENPWYPPFIEGIANGTPITPDGLEAYYLEFETIVQKHISRMLFRNIAADKAMLDLQGELEEFVARKSSGK